MKRRGTSRRQVLELETNSSSPKRLWQTKYQQICMDHMNNSNSEPVPSQNGSDSVVSEKKLPQLVGYASDSESDEPKKHTDDINTKVENFLKEISDIAPMESVNQNKNILDAGVKAEVLKKSVKKGNLKQKPLVSSMPVTAKSVPTLQENLSVQPKIAWQECYDESSGCYYYWNTETNEVTWEMPQDLRAYHIVLEQWNAQQGLLSQQAVGGLTPMYMPDSHLPASQQHQKKLNTNKSQEKVKNKRSKSNSESEDEKIELITSYGPTSDDEDSGSEHEPINNVHASKKKKTEGLKPITKKEKKEIIAIGPQLPPNYMVPSKKEIEPGPPGVEDSQSISSDKLLSVPGTEPINKDPQFSSKPKDKVVEKNLGDVLIINNQLDNDKISNLQRLKTLKNKDSDDSTEVESDTSEDGPKKENNDNDENEDNEEEDDDLEDSILERLKNQAKILQELGGEIPEAIKELIESKPIVAEEKTDIEFSKSENLKIEAPVCEMTQKIVELKEIEGTEIHEDKNEEIDKMQITKTNGVLEKIELVENIESSDKIEVLDKSNNTTENISKSIANGARLDKVLLQEQAPTSFSLIASYGNEDDSEIDEDKVDDKPKNSEKPVPLFPILDSEKDKTSTKITKKKIIKLSAKAKELIHSSTTTERARATDFVNTSEGLRPAGSLASENEVTSNLDNKTNFTAPIKKVARKKRIEVPVVIHRGTFKKSKTTDSCRKENLVDNINNVTPNIVTEKTETITEHTTTPYTSTWAYNSELRGGEYRGFGYSHVYDQEEKRHNIKKGMIQFVKADVLISKNESGVTMADKKPQGETKEEEETKEVQMEQATELAQVISEKVKFLIEGKNAVPPVQVMAIQLETLMAALVAGGLCVKYLLEWLTSVNGQLASLEQAAAPLGWLCQWDRSFKRYYYRNEESGIIQWEFPSELPTQGGEEAMELCDSPPPPPSGTQLHHPTTPPPPPRISSRSPSPEITGKANPPLPPMPPPPPVISERPPLPPMPPPPSEAPPPPPLPPSPPPPPPPPIISTSLLSGEPLPPGVDLPEEMFDDVRPPLPVTPPPPPKTPPPPLPKTPPPPPPPPDMSDTVEPVYNIGGYDVTSVPMHYDPYQIQPGHEYTSHVYVGATYSSGGENYVIARPPASNPVSSSVCLASELDSFYTEVAALEPPASSVPSPSPPPPPLSPLPQVQPAEPTKKKKKTKLTPGLALKKKGVSSLVAKWQQVQQDVRREAASEET